MSPDASAFINLLNSRSLFMICRQFWAVLLIFGLVASAPVGWAAPAQAEDPVNSPHVRKAQTLSSQGNWTEAVAAFRNAATEYPDNGWVHANLGVALSRTERHKEALLAFEKALSLGYDNARFRYTRGLSFAKVNLLAEAAREIETALDMDSQLSFADYDLGLIYEQMGARDKALAQVTKLYRRNKTQAKKLYFQLSSNYKIASVDHGGTLKGTVRLAGPVPKPRAFHLIHMPNIEFCARISDGRGHRIVHDFVVGERGELKDTVIAILNVPKGKPFPREMQKVNIDRCRANKYVIGIKNGENILVENTDPIKHEMALYEVNGVYKYQVSYKNLLPNTSQVRSTFMKPGSPQMILQCNLHPFLQTRGFLVDNPYYTVTDEAGRFEIPDIPPGTYEVVAWHPFIPQKQGTITIEEDRTATLHFTFNGEDEGRKLYQNDTEGYRFNTWFDSKENFYGGERQDDPVEILQEFDNSDRYLNWKEYPSEQ